MLMEAPWVETELNPPLMAAAAAAAAAVIADHMEVTFIMPRAMVPMNMQVMEDMPDATIALPGTDLLVIQVIPMGMLPLVIQQLAGQQPL
jgi:hypothetical protein